MISYILHTSPSHGGVLGQNTAVKPQQLLITIKSQESRVKNHLKDVPTPLKSSIETLLVTKLVIEPSKFL